MRVYRKSVMTKSKKCSSFSTLREPSVNRKDLRAVTLVEPPKDNLEIDPLAVLHLNNQLYIMFWGALVVRSCCWKSRIDCMFGSIFCWVNFLWNLFPQTCLLSSIDKWFWRILSHTKAAYSDLLQQKMTKFEW